ncbi:uncharacterized protein LOC116294865 [Actinia tenebrosa]|uniref:Uncharacterized protein LOC116294865 n=1 Tax=Actinia tenebrosa TaxID=6105 RepID=A0A6P8I0J8_ACTTE|nr:uncharacterized protein LOC116294865 [Actinia tenebrosa]
MLFKLLCLLLLCCISSCSERERERQTCGEDKFYCPRKDNNYDCLDRGDRCTNKKVCVDFESDQENKCYEASAGRYYYYKKQSSLTSSGSSKSKRLVEGWNFNHWFLEYRGFAYEFGTYGAQELDVNDPNYKYGPGREKVVQEGRLGASSCTRDDVLRYCDAFLKANSDYEFWSNNCQHFFVFLEKLLRNDCSPRTKRSLDDEMKSLKSNCTVSNQNSSSSMLALNWKPFASFATLTALSTIFCM